MLLTEGGSRGRSPHRKFPAVILRVAGIYGPGRGHWFKQFLKGEAHIEGNGSRCLNMIHRDDVVGCIIAALKNGRAGEIYNAVDDEPVTQLIFFEWLAAKLKRPMPPTIAAEAEIRRKRGVTNKRVSNAKLRTELKYEFHFPNFRKGYGAEIFDAWTAAASNCALTSGVTGVPMNHTFWSAALTRSGVMGNWNSRAPVAS